MIRLAAEAWVSVVGSWKLLTFKTGWQSLFDISVAGFWRSFGAALVALPLVLFASVHQWHLSGNLHLAPQLVLYSASWIVFPATAALVAAILGTRNRFVHWVVLHNWSVVLLYALTTLMWTLHTARLIDTFYAELARPGQTRAGALREAQRRVRESPRFEHPGYWAPFLMISSWL